MMPKTTRAQLLLRWQHSVAQVNFLYHAASMQGSLSHGRNVRQSVKRMNCDKTKETYAHIPHERMVHLVF